MIFGEVRRWRRFLCDTLRGRLLMRLLNASIALRGAGWSRWCCFLYENFRLPVNIRAFLRGGRECRHCSCRSLNIFCDRCGGFLKYRHCRMHCSRMDSRMYLRISYLKSVPSQNFSAPQKNALKAPLYVCILQQKRHCIPIPLHQTVENDNHVMRDTPRQKRRWLRPHHHQHIHGVHIHHKTPLRTERVAIQYPQPIAALTDAPRRRQVISLPLAVSGRQL